MCLSGKNTTACENDVFYMLIQDGREMPAKQIFIMMQLYNEYDNLMW